MMEDADAYFRPIEDGMMPNFSNTNTLLSRITAKALLSLMLDASLML